MRVSPTLSLALLASLLTAGFVGACGGGGDTTQDDPNSTHVATAGQSGAGGAHSVGGSGGASGGKAGHAGVAGATGGKGGASGASGGGQSGHAGVGATGGASGAGGQSGSAGASAAGASAAGAGGSSTVTLVVSPPTMTQSIPLGGPAGTVSFTGMEQTTDVTSKATWSLSNTALGSVKNGVVTLTGVGGVTTVTASLNGVVGTASLTVKVTGDVVPMGMDPTTVMNTFGSATPDPNPQDPTPALEYPLDGVVLPANLPTLDAQWADDGDSTLFRLHLLSTGLDLNVYTDQRELVLPATVWAAVQSSTQDSPTTLEVTGVGPKGLHASASATMTVVSDTLPASAIYVWQNSTQTFHVLDIVNGTDDVLPTTTPVGGSSGCVGCHRISRDGQRFSYTATSSYLNIGTLTYDKTAKQFSPPATPGQSLGTYATFYPLEGTTGVAAMLYTKPDFAGQNVPNDVLLELVDPDSYAPFSSNVSTMLSQLPAGDSTHALMPDWSPAGDFVTFVGYDGSTNYVREPGDDVVLGNIWQASVSYDANAKSFTFGQPEVLVQTPDTNPDTGQNNFLPTVSPDGSAIAFTRANGWWSVKTQNTAVTPLNISGHIAIVRRSDKQVFELAGGTAGPNSDYSSTWPQWAPSYGVHYAFLAFASERPYGHLLTAANNQCTGLIQGQKQCKQLWIMAIDLTKLGDPTNTSDDPSSPPFRVPGQPLDVQNVSPQWTVPADKP
jgi:hypothetical protein